MTNSSKTSDQSCPMIKSPVVLKDSPPADVTFASTDIRLKLDAVEPKVVTLPSTTSNSLDNFKKKVIK